MDKRRERQREMMSKNVEEHTLPPYMVYVWKKGFLVLALPYIFLDYIMYAYRYRKGLIEIQISKFCRLLSTPLKHGNAESRILSPSSLGESKT